MTDPEILNAQGQPLPKGKARGTKDPKPRRKVQLLVNGIQVATIELAEKTKAQKR